MAAITTKDFTIEFRTILFEATDKIATITLNRPDNLNPIDPEIGEELRACLDRIEADKRLQITVCRGGGRAFSAGGDVGEGHLRYHMLRTDGPSHPEEMSQMMSRFTALFGRLGRSEKIVIGLIHGISAGGGSELITASDIIVAGSKALFADARINVGQLPGAGASQRLARLIGPIRANELLLSGRFIGAQEAQQIGLATYSVDFDELQQKLDTVVCDMLSKSFAAGAAMKYFVNQGLRLPLPSAIEMERLYSQHYLTTHPDSLEGLNAFWQKREAKYQQPG